LLPLKIDIALAIVVNKPADDRQLFFCFGREIYDNMPLLNCQSHYISQIYVNNHKKTFADVTCFSLQAMFMFRILLLLLLSIKTLSAVYDGHRKLSR